MKTIPVDGVKQPAPEVYEQPDGPAALPADDVPGADGD
jgi:hypothetical protein